MDDILAILLALLTPHVDLKLISLCFGNCDTVHSLRNVLTLFNVIALEQKHHEEHLKKGLSTAKDYKIHSKPTIAVGLETALDGSQLDATDFHGSDGLGNVHEKAPHFTAHEEWQSLFKRDGPAAEKDHPNLGFIPSNKPSYNLILDILREEPADSVVIVAIGPLMNLAKAAELEPETFAKVKHVVAMGGVLRTPGNVTPFAEFNIYSDPLAAKRVFDLTGAQQNSIQLTLLPLDLTNRQNMLHRDFFKLLHKRIGKTDTHDGDFSPLVEWTSIWMQKTFDTFHKIAGYDLKSDQEKERDPLKIQMHDPLAVWYAITVFDDSVAKDDGLAKAKQLGWIIDKDLDIRVETLGEYTKGITLLDQRSRPKREEPTLNDHNKWLLQGFGNKVHVTSEAPYAPMTGEFGRLVLQTVYKEEF